MKEIFTSVCGIGSIEFVSYVPIDSEVIKAICQVIIAVITLIILLKKKKEK